MHTSPHWTIVGAMIDPKNAALPSEPWLSTTAGKGPLPAGLYNTPARSYWTPPTVPRKVQVAPAEVAGSPTTLKPVSGSTAVASDPPQASSDVRPTPAVATIANNAQEARLPESYSDLE